MRELTRRDFVEQSALVVGGLLVGPRGVAGESWFREDAGDIVLGNDAVSGTWRVIGGSLRGIQIADLASKQSLPLSTEVFTLDGAAI